MIGRGKELCRFHWDYDQEAVKSPEAETGASFKRDHWVVVMAKVECGLYNNRFNDGKCDPMGRLWAGLYPFDFLLKHTFAQ